MLDVQSKAIWIMRATTAALAVAVAQPAMAQISQEQYAYYQAPQGKQSTAVLSIPVRASVNTSCGFQQIIDENFDVGYIDEAQWTRSTTFVPECTTPWRIAISSTNGGLLTDNTASLPVGYANKAPYTVALNINTDGGVEEASCAAADLHDTAGTACAFRGTATMTEGMRVARSYRLNPSQITVSAPAYAGPGVLISGTYTDTLTITVSPSA